MKDEDLNQHNKRKEEESYGTKNVSHYYIDHLGNFFLPFSAIGADKGCYLSMKAGIYSPDSDDLEDFDEGFAGEIALGHYFNQNLAVELGAGYFETEEDIFGVEADLMVIPVTLTVKPILPIGNLELYGLAGIGAYFVDGELGSLDDSDTDCSPHAGLGFSYKITENLSFGVEGKYLWTSAEFKDAGAKTDVHLDGYVVMGGLAFHFGGEKEKEVAPPPPADSDGDGVYDDYDKCPGTPAGVKVDSSGCPLDSDGDGVPDHLDECPDTPEGATVNSKGCWALTGMVLFDFDSATIKPEAYPLLDEVVTILEKNPEMKGEIQGHTDSIGPEAYNQQLSERRAKAVEGYLESKGIESSRLTSKGYGESQPVASNDTEEGRQENRRVRLKRIN